jgi:hypothetical protein
MSVELQVTVPVECTWNVIGDQERKAAGPSIYTCTEETANGGRLPSNFLHVLTIQVSRYPCAGARLAPLSDPQDKVISDCGSFVECIVQWPTADNVRCGEKGGLSLVTMGKFDSIVLNTCMVNLQCPPQFWQTWATAEGEQS